MAEPILVPRSSILLVSVGDRSQTLTKKIENWERECGSTFPLSYFKIAHGIKPQPPVLWSSVLSALLTMQQILMNHGGLEC